MVGVNQNIGGGVFELEVALGNVGFDFPQYLASLGLGRLRAVHVDMPPGFCPTVLAS